MVADLSESVIQAVGRVLAAARSIDERAYRAKPATNLLVVDRDAIHSGLKDIAGVDLMSVLRGLVQQRPAPAQDTTDPADITGLAVTLDVLVPVITSDLGVDAGGIAGYLDRFSIDNGATWTDLPVSASVTRRHDAAAGLGGTTIKYQRKARDLAGRVSVNWTTAVSVTIPGTDLPDTGAPLTPSAPTLVSKDTTNIRIAITPTTDAVQSGHVQTGMRRYHVQRNGTIRGYVDHPTGGLSAFADYLIGSPGTPGSVTDVGGVITLSGVACGDWWGTTDQLRMRTKPVQGPGFIKGRIASVSGGRWAKAALVVRDGQGNTARNIAFVTFGADGYKVEYRASQGAATLDTALFPGVPPQFGMIERVSTNAWKVSVGDTINGPWTVIATPTIDMSAVAEFGVGLASQDPATPATAAFDNITIAGASPVIFADTGLPNTAYSYRIAAGDNATPENVSGFSAALAVTTDADTTTTTVHDYPRLAAGVVGDPQNYPEQYWPQLANHDVIVIGGGDESFGTYYGQDRRDKVCAGIKALNPNAKIFQYACWDNYSTNPLRYPTFNASVEANPTWRLKTSYPGGSYVPNFFNSNWTQINPDPATGTDGNGDHATGNFGRFAVRAFTGQAGNNKSDKLDGIFFDNILWKPRGDGDYNLDGTSESQNNSTTQLRWRTGLKDIFDAARQENPNLIYLGNLSDWPNAGNGSYNLADVSPLSQAAGGSFAEYIYGTPGVAFGEWGGFITALKAYRLQIDGSRDPKIVIFTHMDIAANGIDAASPSLPAYQKMRYGLTTCLLDRGYFYATRNAYYQCDQLNWFDEYRGGALNQRGYLRQPIDAPPTGPYDQGVWRRKFEGGVVYVNPKGNGDKTITLEKPYRKITGSQAPSVNNGALVSSVTIKDEDGIILLDPAVYG